MYSVQTQIFSIQYFHPMVACIHGCGICDAQRGPAAFYLLLDAVTFKMCLHHNNAFSVRRVACIYFFFIGNTNIMLSKISTQFQVHKSKLMFLKDRYLELFTTEIPLFLHLTPPPEVFLISGSTMEVSGHRNIWISMAQSHLEV